MTLEYEKIAINNADTLRGILEGWTGSIEEFKERYEFFGGPSMCLDECLSKGQMTLADFISRNFTPRFSLSSFETRAMNFDMIKSVIDNSLQPPVVNTNIELYGPKIDDIAEYAGRVVSKSVIMSLSKDTTTEILEKVVQGIIRSSSYHLAALTIYSHVNEYHSVSQYPDERREELTNAVCTIIRSCPEIKSLYLYEGPINSYRVLNELYESPLEVRRVVIYETPYSDDLALAYIKLMVKNSSPEEIKRALDCFDYKESAVIETGQNVNLSMIMDKKRDQSFEAGIMASSITVVNTFDMMDIPTLLRRFRGELGI